MFSLVTASDVVAVDAVVVAADVVVVVVRLAIGVDGQCRHLTGFSFFFSFIGNWGTCVCFWGTIINDGGGALRDCEMYRSPLNNEKKITTGG